MKQLALAIIFKLFFATNTFAQVGYYTYTGYTAIHKYLKSQKIVQPVKGYIYRKRYYKGVFIKPSYRAKFVKSALSGRVVFCDFLKYYGYVIIIAHKNHLKTVYARIKKPLVKKGEFVRKGQVIGVIYRKESVYFEVRKKTKPLNTYALLKR